MVAGATNSAPEVKSRLGRKPGQIPRYTIGVLYAVAYRNLKKTPEQIAKFCKVDVNVVKAGLRAHGFDLEKAKEKQVREKEREIQKLQAKVSKLEHSLKKIIEKAPS